MSWKFVDRKCELSLLENRLGSGKGEFIVIYGRRRVGKTALIMEFLKRHGGIYLLARETSDLENLKRFSERIALYFNDEVLLKNPFQSWDALFEYLHQKSLEERLIVAIDEFPYLVLSNRALPSILQEYWDTKFYEGKLYLIISGSSVSMMERLLGYKSPLYGRRTAQLKMEPLDFFSAREFLPGFTLEDFVRAYSILGGTPAYLLEFEDNLTLAENLLERYFRQDSLLYSDAQFVLREELDRPRLYFAILEAIARGRTTVGEIMNETGLERATVGKYVSVLIDLGIVRRDVPVTESRKSKKGRYYINDPYFAFWFRYVYPNADLIETGNGDMLLRIVMNDLDEYVGRIFEDIARQFLLKKSRELPLRPTKIGRWWSKGEEVDLVLLDEIEKKALLVEVKWKELRKRDAFRVFEKLAGKSQLMGLKDWKFEFGIIAKRVEPKEELRELGYVWDLDDMGEVA
ncbi:ATP-binding protein [Thermococcus sp.]|uniref:ATP-binding protein n=1 Tax=Thermococcus sp. TaxID=35749 RepID=UPI00260AB705|nr:ATP-binding protein [Thermococcus sp.]